MASNLLVTGKWGEVHVTSAQQRNFNSGVVGDGQYVMNGLTATMSDSNTLHVDPGVACMNGADVEVPAGGVDVTVTNGTQGMLRNDLICMRYTMDGPTQKEKAELVCVRGTPAAADPQDPEYNGGSILDGSLVVDMPLYRISLDGINAGDPEPLFETIPSIDSLRDSVSQAAALAHPGGSVVILRDGLSPSDVGLPGEWARKFLGLSLTDTSRALNCYGGGTANQQPFVAWDENGAPSQQMYITLRDSSGRIRAYPWLRVA